MPLEVIGIDPHRQPPEKTILDIFCEVVAHMNHQWHFYIVYIYIHITYIYIYI
jgi:hypothetical protein